MWPIVAHYFLVISSFPAWFMSYTAALATRISLEGGLGMLAPGDLDVLAGDGAAAGRARGQDAVLADVQDVGAAGSDGGAVLDGRAAGELDGAEVGERHVLAVVARVALGEVLDDPLRVDLAQAGRLLAEALGDGLASGQVLDDGRSGRLGRRRDGHLDRITLGDIDVEVD